MKLILTSKKNLLKVSGTPGIFKVGTSGYRTTTIGTWITKSLPFRDLSIFEEYESSGEDVLGDTTISYGNQDSSKIEKDSFFNFGYRTKGVTTDLSF